MSNHNKPAPKNDPLPFAHPFFTSTPPADRAPSPGGHGRRMTDFILQTLGPIPKPTRDPVMKLEEIIGVDPVKAIEAVGSIRFHTTGDTGRSKAGEQTKDVGDDMALDFHPDSGGLNPAFFLHLGDVIYDANKASSYLEQFYSPYKGYPGKIIAIPGNHDGEVLPPTDPISLDEFLKQFCAAEAVVPPIAEGAGIFRQTMTQPGVYWLLEAPFVQIVGLYSNKKEGPGILTGDGNDTQQTNWLAKTLGQIAKEQAATLAAGQPRKALLLAVHHPPFSNGGHAGSEDMLKQIDGICTAAGVMPDAVISGHAHNYQRHTRRLNFAGKPWEIPFLVVGCGGHNDLAVGEAYGQPVGDHTFDKSMRGYGYVLASISPQRLKFDFWAVPSNTHEPYDTVTVDLTTHRLV